MGKELRAESKSRCLFMKIIFICKEARSLVKCVYLLINTFPPEEKYALCDQMRRATV